MRVLVVGMNPSNAPTGAVHKKNSTFDRLNKWMDAMGVKYFSFVNCAHDTGAINKITSEEADYLRSCIQDHDVVLTLGGFAHACTKKLNVESFKLPHPSPRNRLLNDRSFEARVLDDCKRYIMELKHD